MYLTLLTLIILCCSFSENLYLFGGWDGTKDLSDFWLFNVPSKEWTCLGTDTHKEVRDAEQTTILHDFTNTFKRDKFTELKFSLLYNYSFYQVLEFLVGKNICRIGCHKIIHG